MKNSIENNLRVWDSEYHWSHDGDEWDGQARVCGQPYDAWKRSVVETFLVPNLAASSRVLEIGPGHGRWSKEIVDRCGELILVDLSPSCLEHCRELFKGRKDVSYQVTDGASLPNVASESIDFLWSYDVFVHMEPGVVASYLTEAQRVLKPDGRAIVHHAGRRGALLPLRFLRRFGQAGTALYDRLSLGPTASDGGWRSDVSRSLFQRLAKRSGLKVDEQIDRWGPSGEFGVPRYRDAVTLLSKP
ncbi:MAG: class I SAM-dependent methyltransferase [Acidobacteriota bacterium]